MIGNKRLSIFLQCQLFYKNLTFLTTSLFSVWLSSHKLLNFVIIKFLSSLFAYWANFASSLESNVVLSCFIICSISTMYFFPFFNYLNFSLVNYWLDYIFLCLKATGIIECFVWTSNISYKKKHTHIKILYSSINFTKQKYF